MVTSSAQTALEVNASRGREIYPVNYLSEYGIEIIDAFNIEMLQSVLQKSVENTEKILKEIDDKKIISKL